MDRLRRQTVVPEERVAGQSQHLTVPSPSIHGNEDSYLLSQILEIPTTAILLLFGFILPVLKSWTADLSMGKSFEPERDIGSLDGKVILVTGGTLSCQSN